ncbi:MAG TPA: NTP transferase domain-containing protein [Armatimonadota bacterium]|jgi:N-acetylgalactosamine kinase
MPAAEAPRPLVSVILAAGKGSRMNAPNRHKVCFPLGGDTVIRRAVRLYADAGASAHYVVVGALADQVRDALKDSPERHVFCPQAEQRGTGNAARAAADALRAEGYSGDVLVVAGDKVIAAGALRSLLEAFRSTGCDMAFITGDTVDFPTSGRVLHDGAGRPAAIVEVADIARAELLSDLRRITAVRPVAPGEALALFAAAFPTEKKAATAMGSLWEIAASGEAIDRERLDAVFPDTGDDVSAANALGANLSVYVFRARALYAAVDALSSDNAQREEYLTDAVRILAARRAAIVTVPVARATDVMAFNTPEEYERVVRHLAGLGRVAGADRPDLLRAASQRLAEMKGPASRLASVYGEGADLGARRALLIKALEGYVQRFGDEPVLVARAPGRLNVMGRHIDHQGGCGNFLAIDREAVLIIGPREDRRVIAHSVDGDRFPEATFSTDDAVHGYSGQPWLDYVNGPDVTGRTASRRGEWSLYLESAVARFQAFLGDRPLRGMNIAAAGDIPIAAGLSSSSALVVAAAEGIVALNHISVAPERFVELCGEGEWYVGTRGGAGDHAAMKFARQGHTVQMGFLPFRVMTAAPLSPGDAFLVCHSGVAARKNAGVRDAFNHRVACYHIGRELLKARFPEHAARIEHLRDITPENLGLAPASLLGLLRALPAKMSRDEVRAALPPETAEHILATHSEEPGPYPVRAVVTYGLAECERSRMCVDLLVAGRSEEFGRWMNVSHDGDRVARWRDGAPKPFRLSYGDAEMDSWIAAANRGEPTAEMAGQPGAYACSLPEIDHMVDIALTVPGVRGAQLSGAGLGGCIMVLADRSAMPAVRAALTARYYGPASVDPVMFACHAVSGSGLIE